MFISIKHSVFTAGTASLLSLGSLAVASPSYGFSLDLSTWEKIGDVNPISSTQATLNSGTENTAFTGGGAGSVENFLNITPGSLDPAGSIFGTTQGSAIKTVFTNIQVGDVLSFDWDFSTNDGDTAFATINDSVIALTGNTRFQYSFATTSSTSFGIGVVDVDDAIGGSQLIVSNAKIDPVPEPITILGSLTALGFGVNMRRRFGKKNSASV